MARSEVSAVVPLVFTGMVSTGCGVEADEDPMKSPMQGTRMLRMVQWLLGALGCLALAACSSPDEGGSAATVTESAQALSGLGGSCTTVCDCALGATDCIGGTCQYRGFSPPNPQACGSACQCHSGDSCVNGSCVPPPSSTLSVATGESPVTVTGGGTTNTCGASCNFTYLTGTSLTLTAGLQNLVDCLRFSSWSGACSGQGRTCSLVLNSNLSTSAVYSSISGCVPK